MKCAVCKSEMDDPPVRCRDCGKPCCDLCRADFPHHDPPHARCEDCYFEGPPNKRKQRKRERDDTTDADWWKK